MNREPSTQATQSGWVLMVFLAVLAAGSSSYFAVQVTEVRPQQQVRFQLQTLQKLQLLKQQLLNYAVLFPENYSASSSSTNGPMLDFSQIGGPGYFPCPSNDLTTGFMRSDCAAEVDKSGVVQGFLLRKIVTRHLYFHSDLHDLDDFNEVVWIVDARLVMSNPDYHPESSLRFAPLNSNLPGPYLTLNDDGQDYVALLILPNEAQNDQALKRPALNPAFDLTGYLDARFADASLTQALDNNIDGNRHFYSQGFSQGQPNFGVNDLVVGIRLAEWQQAIEQRVCTQKTRLLASDPLVPFWFNAYDPATNPVGTDWRTWVEEGGCESD